MNLFLQRLEDAPPFDFNNSEAYGKIDEIEAIPGDSNHAMLWYNLIAIKSLYQCGLQRRHNYQLQRRLASFDENPFEKAVIYRIEIRIYISPKYPTLDDYLLEHQDIWFKFTVRNPTNNVGNSRLYTNLFTNSIPSQVRFNPVDAKRQKMLTDEFSLDTADTITVNELEQLIADSTTDLRYLAAYDVGQGNSNGLISATSSACPDIYFDIGAGVSAHRRTKPVPLDFCFSKQPLVIMSHWDHDHWAGACPIENQPSDALKMTWIVTRQNLDAAHKTFAIEVGKNEGKILVLDMPPGTVGKAVLKNNMSIRFTLGDGRTRNDSGIVLSIENNDPQHPACWLLTGDCDYRYFLNTLQPPPAVAIIAPHHGSKPKSSSVAPPPVQTQYRRLVYSYGHNNGFKHPTPESVQLHNSAGWGTGSWSIMPGDCVKTADICSTSDHTTVAARGGVLIGWQAPSAPLPNCHGCGVNSTLVNC